VIYISRIIYRPALSTALKVMALAIVTPALNSHVIAATAVNWDLVLLFISMT